MNSNDIQGTTITADSEHAGTAFPGSTALAAPRLAAIALGHLSREYPHRVDHVLTGPEDPRAPRALHPIFYGSFDWHSCVHGYWMLARLYRRVPTLDAAPRIRAQFDTHLTSRNVAGELDYLRPPARGTFERPYGWAWMLMLGAELARHTTPEGRRWSAALAPLVAEFVRRFHGFLPRATYPVRVGTHFNTAFALALAMDYATVADDSRLADLLREKANAWYGADTDCQAWEPGGDDFLSSALIEAECMRRVMPPHGFEHWLARFLPRIADQQPATLFRPVRVSDRHDGKIAHLDGLNLTRAWCWRSIADALPPADPRVAVAREAADRHLAAGLPHVTGDYAGEHCLASFALLALEARVNAL